MKAREERRGGNRGDKCWMEDRIGKEVKEKGRGERQKRKGRNGTEG